MTTTNTNRDPYEITGLVKTIDAIRAIYLTPEYMDAWLSCDTVANRLRAALHCSDVAADPRYRFRLESVPADVKAVIARHLEAARRDAAPVVEELRALRAQGLSWDECWTHLEDPRGFGHGDARLLGF